jgi:flagellar hook-associated protein 2
MSTSSIGSTTTPTLFALGNSTTLPITSTSSSSTSSSGTSSSGPLSLAVSGLESGLNWQSLVTEIEQADRAPETVLQNQQTTNQQQNTALGTIVSALQKVQTDVTALQQNSLYDVRSTNVADPTILSATAGDSTTAGTYTFDIGQLASASVQNGATDISGALNSTNDVSNLILANAHFSQPVTAGTITVNGAQINITTGETLQNVFDAISTATGGAVTGRYNSSGGSADTIALSSASPITLGSTTDTSNFLQVAQLYNSNIPADTITSANKLGSVQLGATLANANLATPITGDSSGNGSFTINGVAIQYNVNTDTISGLLNKINSSGASVTASYDTINNRFVVTNASTGNLGVSLQDNTGNFLAASGISSGTLVAGKNLEYSINGGGQRVGYSNTISASDSGITGLSVTALNGGTTTVQVQADTSNLSSAITQLVADYNSAQAAITAQTAVTTSSTGAITAAALSNDPSVMNLASQLREAVFGQISGLSGSINQLAQLGFTTDGQDNTITQSDTTALPNALSTNLSAVQDFFTNSTNGLATTLSTFTANLVGDSTGTTGSLVNEQTNLTKQSSNLTNQINTIEQSVLAEGARLTTEFEAMETAMAQINTQQQYLTQAISSGSL